ncbi:APC family permease [Streptomyces sp. NPDC013178]|uniref:APC family permease n=1 Tax=Streptomyces sp. NPDC013178 TaxID=3155118 RepID=UPI0033DCEFEE
MSAADQAAALEDTPHDTSATALSGTMGVLELIFTVMAYNGPAVVFLGFLPVAILLGNGVGTPVAILVCGLVIAMVAFGLVKMAGRLDKPGGFYAMITAGLGRTTGLAAGFTALTCYFLVLVGVYALGGMTLGAVIQDLFDGPHIAWWVLALPLLALATVLGHFNINFSAKVLTFFLMCELALMAVYDVAVLVQGGAHGIGFDSFTPHQISSGSISIAFLFGIGLFGGFEATVIFRDEVRKPESTIPRATYGVVALLAGMYSLTAWCFINSYGADAVMGAVSSNLTGSAKDSVKDYVGQFAYDSATVMFFTSSIALILAAHSITARYLFNLGADGIFPQSLGKAHPRHVSPHRASIVVSIAALITLVGVILAEVPESQLYALLAGLYTYAFMILMVLVALAIGVYLLRDRLHGPAVAPAISSFIAFGIMGLTLVLATENFTLLTGAAGMTKTALLTLIWGVTVLGAVYAVVVRRKKPEVYARIGRQ